MSRNSKACVNVEVPFVKTRVQFCDVNNIANKFFVVGNPGIVRLVTGTKIILQDKVINILICHLKHIPHSYIIHLKRIRLMRDNMELHFHQNSIFVLDTQLVVFFAVLHNVTFNCVDFVFKLMIAHGTFCFSNSIHKFGMPN